MQNTPSALLGIQKKPLHQIVVSMFSCVCVCVCSMQVNVNILEAQKLAGVNINPAVFIRVGNQKKNTQTQKSTNCPFYNEVQTRLSRKLLVV